MTSNTRCFHRGRLPEMVAVPLPFPTPPVPAALLPCTPPLPLPPSFPTHSSLFLALLPSTPPVLFSALSSGVLPSCSPSPMSCPCLLLRHPSSSLLGGDSPHMLLFSVKLGADVGGPEKLRLESCPIWPVVCVRVWSKDDEWGWTGVCFSSKELSSSAHWRQLPQCS